MCRNGESGNSVLKNFILLPNEFFVREYACRPCVACVSCDMRNEIRKCAKNALEIRVVYWLLWTLWCDATQCRRCCRVSFPFIYLHIYLFSLSVGIRNSRCRHTPTQSLRRRPRWRNGELVTPSLFANGQICESYFAYIFLLNTRWGHFLVIIWKNARPFSRIWRIQYSTISAFRTFVVDMQRLFSWFQQNDRFADVARQCEWQSGREITGASIALNVSRWKRSILRTMRDCDRIWIFDFSSLWRQVYWMLNCILLQMRKCVQNWSLVPYGWDAGDWCWWLSSSSRSRARPNVFNQFIFRYVIMETTAVHLSEREKALKRWNKNTITKYDSKRDESQRQMRMHCIETDKAVELMRKIRTTVILAKALPSGAEPIAKWLRCSIQIENMKTIWKVLKIFSSSREFVFWCLRILSLEPSARVVQQLLNGDARCLLSWF